MAVRLDPSQNIVGVGWSEENLVINFTLTPGGVNTLDAPNEDVYTRSSGFFQAVYSNDEDDWSEFDLFSPVEVISSEPGNTFYQFGTITAQDNPIVTINTIRTDKAGPGSSGVPDPPPDSFVFDFDFATGAPEDVVGWTLTIAGFGEWVSEDDPPPLVPPSDFLTPGAGYLCTLTLRRGTP
jgi:hypothetical protein